MHLKRLRSHVPSYFSSRWGILFSHPRDFTPVCTTELARAAKLSDEFKKRDVKMIALSIDSVEDHRKWSEVCVYSIHVCLYRPSIAGPYLILFFIMTTAFLWKIDAWTSNDVQCLLHLSLIGSGRSTTIKSQKERIYSEDIWLPKGLSLANCHHSSILKPINRQFFKKHLFRT